MLEIVIFSLPILMYSNLLKVCPFVVFLCLKVPAFFVS